MKKFLLIGYILLLISTVEVKGQYITALDNAGNYTSWTNNSNQGFGFGPWNLWTTDGAAGHFLGSSHAGLINTGTPAQAFGLWGNPGWSNAQRMFTHPLNPGQTFTMELSVNWRSGGRGVDILNAAFGIIFNFNIIDHPTPGYGPTGWGWHENSAIRLTITQTGANSFTVQAFRINDNATWSSGSLTGVVAGFRAYAGNLGGSEGQRNLFINNFRIETSNPAAVRPTENVQISGHVTLAPAATLTVNNLTIPAGNSFTIASTAAGTGSLITLGTVTGNVRVERHLPNANHWYYISSPVDLGASNFGAIFPGGAGNNPVPTDFYRWAENFEQTGVTGWWFNIQHQGEWTTTSFAPGRGYAISYATSPTTITLTGAPYNANQTIAMTRTAGSRGEGWNLVGNPFPATIAANDPAQTTNNLIAANAAALDASFTGVYLWNDITNDYLVLTHGSPATRLQPGQAFMVRSAANNNTFAMNTAKRIHGAATFFKTGNDPLRVTLRVNAPENSINETELVFLNGMTLGLDPGYDAGKLQGNPNLSLYTSLVESNGERFAIQALPMMDETVIVPVGLYAGIAGEYSIALAEQSSLPATSPVILEDRTLGVFTNLHEVQQYVFNVEAAATIENRFFLHFMTVGINEPGIVSQPFAYTSGNMLYLMNPSAQRADVQLFTLHGKQMEQFRITGQGIHSRMLSLPAGIYIVRMSSESGVVSAKVFVK